LLYLPFQNRGGLFLKELKYLVFCINEYAHFEGVSTASAFEILLEHGILEFLEECYDTMHLEGTLGMLVIIVDMLIRKGYYPAEPNASQRVYRFSEESGVNY
jgi:hypothetical protein